MVLLDILYNITIYPIEFIIETLFYLFNNVFQYSYPISLFLLSLSVSILSLPLYITAEKWKKEEEIIQSKMKPDIDHIKKNFKGDEKFLLIQACYKIYKYKTVYALRSTLGLLIQIPFFLAAYNFIHNLQGLENISFLLIKDLASPDKLIHIGNTNINILPFIMSFFSLLSGIIYYKRGSFKDNSQIYIIPLIFLILLYNSPSGLLFYWTLNCFFSLVKNIIIKYKNNININALKSITKKLKLLDIHIIPNNIKKINTIIIIILSLLLLIMFILCNIQRKGYLDKFELISNNLQSYDYNMRISYYNKIFRNSDIFGVYIDKKYLNNNNILNITFNDYGSPFGVVTLNDTIENIGKIEIKYKLFIKNYIILIYIILVSILLLINYYKNIINIIHNILNDKISEKRTLLLFMSCLVSAILSGLFIPTTLIANSPQEFKEHYFLIINNISIGIGIFLFYPIFIYFLFSEKIRNYITILSIYFSFIIMINVFIMKGNYININTNFIFYNSELLNSSFNETLLNYTLIILSILIVTFLLYKRKIIIINIYIIILLSLISISIFSMNIIIKESSKIKTYNKLNNAKIFNISKNGENVFVFFLDRAISSYWVDAIEKYPEYKEKLDGFIIYPNTLSYGQITVQTASLYGGYDYLPYELSTNGNYIIKDKHNEAILNVPLALEKYGYKSTILDPMYVNFNDFTDLSLFDKYDSIYAYDNSQLDNYILNKYSNYKINDVKSDKKNRSFRFSILKILPINIRGFFYSKGDLFINNTLFMNTSIYYHSILSSIKNFISINENGNYYNIARNAVTHEPYFFNDDYLPNNKLKSVKNEDIINYKDEYSVRFYYANISAINAIIDLINFLKENNVYDNTKIIVVSDHGEAVNTKAFQTTFHSYYNALLMYKDFNSRGNIEIHTNFMTIADTAYLATKHIPGIKDVFNNKVITNDYKINGANILYFKTWKISEQFTNRYNFDSFFNVKDDIFDLNNWKVYRVDWKNKQYAIEE